MSNTDDAEAIEAIRRTFLTQLVATAGGRQHLLNISVDAEEGDEGQIFEQLADVVEDPKLRRIVEVHRADEERHAALFRGCLERNGLASETVPEELKIIRQIANRTGGFEAGVHAIDDVVTTYALLYVIEERGVQQFPLIADAFESVDPETAEVYRRVARDERGHIRYCEQIGRHYAADEAAWESAVAEARIVEEEAFLHVGLANIACCAERGWVDAGALLAF